MFPNVTSLYISDCKKSQKYNNIGICYHQDEDYKNAQKKYEDAIEKDPCLVDAHYNLAVLHINNNKIKEAKKSLDKCLDNCLDIVVTEREPKVDVKEAARKAKHKLEGSGKLDRSDWYSWWFNSGIRKAVLGIALILILIAIFSPIIMMQILVIDPTIGAFLLNRDLTSLTDTITKVITTQTIAALTITAGVLVGILLLPSLKKFKFGTFEFESLPPSAKHPVVLVPISHHIPSPMEVNMPLKSQPQSFTMPLKYQNLMRQQPLMPVDPVRMPRKVV